MNFRSPLKLFTKLIRKQSSKCHLSKRKFCISPEVTAGVVVIGDEILNGQEEDKNCVFLIKNLNQVGIHVRKISILPDDIDLVSKEVKFLSESCTVVLTTGGIGPTHDDITYEAVAKSFNEDLLLNTELSELYKRYCGPEAEGNPGVAKFARVPRSATLKYMKDELGNNIRYPIVSTHNVYMLPGVPVLLERSFNVFRTTFTKKNAPLIAVDLFLTLDEFVVTALLNDAVEKFKGQVKFGSYPSFTHNYYKVKLVLESPNRSSIDEAKKYLTSKLPREAVVKIEKNVLSNAITKTEELAKHTPKLKLALSVVEESLKKYKISETCICFNGGKDCTAVLQLLYYSMQKRNPDHKVKLNVLYVKSGDTWKEADEFIKSTTRTYNFKLTTLEGDLKSCFIDFCEQNSEIKAVFMGTRYTDPGAESLKHLCDCDSGWPPLLRILPIFYWSYSDVWTFIRHLQLPYCTLYDRGYTSLGPKSKTVQNPALLMPHKKGIQAYEPAYMLENGTKERNGRL